MTDVDSIVAGLSEAEKRALVGMAGTMSAPLVYAGPDLDDYILDELSGLREKGLVERSFGDQGDPIYIARADSVHVNLRACWHFWLSETGLAVRAKLEADNG